MLLLFTDICDHFGALLINHISILNSHFLQRMHPQNTGIGQINQITVLDTNRFIHFHLFSMLVYHASIHILPTCSDSVLVFCIYCVSLHLQACFSKDRLIIL